MVIYLTIKRSTARMQYKSVRNLLSLMQFPESRRSLCKKRQRQGFVPPALSKCFITSRKLPWALGTQCLKSMGLGQFTEGIA
ncbi:MAG: hypothetical protein CMQ03_04020 [Gammaproteobacteria bacterium]|nr:hypothetical protein [Gammaproteobacteria bacterium]